jgi:hypothetical protein
MISPGGREDGHRALSGADISGIRFIKTLRLWNSVRMGLICPDGRSPPQFFASAPRAEARQRLVQHPR